MHTHIPSHVKQPVCGNAFGLIVIAGLLVYCTSLVSFFGQIIESEKYKISLRLQTSNHKTYQFGTDNKPEKGKALTLV
jgi:hypothetical protein